MALPEPGQVWKATTAVPTSLGMGEDGDRGGCNPAGGAGHDCWKVQCLGGRRDVVLGGAELCWWRRMRSLDGAACLGQGPQKVQAPLVPLTQPSPAGTTGRQAAWVRVWDHPATDRLFQPKFCSRNETR